MSATCGLFSPNSSASAALQRSLGNKLSRRFATAGSMEYSLTLNNLVTPAQRDVFRLRASARPTSGSGCSGWPSPNAGPQNDTDTQWEARRAICKERHGNNGFGLTLGMASQLSGWPTAAARDWRDGRSNQHGKNARPLNEVANLAGWETPKTVTAARSARFLKGCTSLNVAEALGPTSSSSPAGTERRGVLNPAFPLWLMGYPATWQCSCPGWQSWDTIQRLLAESSEKPDDTE